jgi:pyrroloquinoline quinone (PQQ) biosynthesis protein C
VINAGSVDEMRAAKEILANELGVVFRSSSPNARTVAADIDPELVGIEGTVDGGTFRFRAAHYEWLLQFAKPLGLGFRELGRRQVGSPATLRFCDELIRLYGSDDFSVSAGAGFAVENWAAAGFWKQLIAGLEIFSERSNLDLNLGFFRWHDKIEDQHAAHTLAELKELYFGPLPFDEDRFVAAGRDMLDGVQVFWDGLDTDRKMRRAA